MKKLLAMVLALVMTLSLAVSANAFTDDSKVNDSYAEAVAVLNGMGVFKGYEDGSFKPEGNITRAEVATIVYRIYTADVAKNDKSGLYATYNKFSDMAGASWAAGYIGYCANASLVKGYPDGTFKPSGNVTGYEVLAMILRAVGYDKNNEFSGADWALHVAQTAQQLGVLDNVAKTTDLNAPASRELVAELLFQGIQKAQVTYTPAFGYVTDKVIGTKNNSLGEKNFKLASAADTDEWGRPATTWTYTTGDKSTTFVEKPVATFTTATTECDIAAAYGLKTNKTFTTYTNGAVNKGQYLVEAKDTVQKLGAQGTLIEVYDNDSIVMIDTFLAKVTDVKDATFDAAGHLKTASSLTMVVYNGAYTQGNASYAGQTLTITNGNENYSYVKGDMVLVSAVMDNASGLAKLADRSNVTPVYAEIQGVAKSMEGAQTFLWYNSKQHTVEGTNYDDAKWFKLDEAGTSTAKYTWYFDNYGNLIGDTLIATAYSYAVIENIQWQNPALSYGYAQATLRYVDNTTDTKVVTKIGTATLNYALESQVNKNDGRVSTSMAANKDQYFGTDLYRVETATDGTVALKHVFTKASAAATGVDSQLDNATIKTGIAAIQGTEGNTTKAIYVNSNTTFMIRTDNTDGSYSYSVVKGYENVGNYTNTATVDYVNLDGDLYADYVYITGTPDATQSLNLFYLTSNNVQAVLKTDGSNAVDYYVVKGYVDGELNEAVKVSANAIATLVPTVNGTAKSNLNEMFTVQFENGVITNAWLKDETTGELPLDLKLHTHADNYNNLVLVKYVPGTGATASWNGESFATKNGDTVTGLYNVVGAKVVVGQFTENMSNKEVYVIYDKSVYVGNAYQAKAVYIADTAETGSSGVITPTEGTIVRTLNIVNKDTGVVIATYSDKVTVTGDTSVTYTTAGMASVLGVSTANLVPFGVSSVTVAPAAGATEYATLSAYYAN